jgi:hypothetical protein
LYTQKPDQALDPNDSTTGDSATEIRDLLVSISTSSAVVSVRKQSEDELKILAGHTSGEDAVQDDLVACFKNLGTIHNPITID